MARLPEIGNTSVVKNAVARARPSDTPTAAIAVPGNTSVPGNTAAVPGNTAAEDPRTADRIITLLLERGGLTAPQLSDELSLTTAGIRRHLDALQAGGRVVAKVRRQPGRGRPAKVFTLTSAGRAQFRHTYDDLAASALRYLATQGGAAAVTEFATAQVAALENRCRQAMASAGDDPMARAEALATALSAEGYAATASAIRSGGQLCQHHCPVAHVAAEFPQLCEAETAAIGRLLGSHVQRLATIAHGDGVCTTHIPGLGQSRGHSNPSGPPHSSPTGSTTTALRG